MRTPYYLIDEAALERNLKVLAAVRKRAGVKILLAQKAFSCYATYPLVAKYLDGATASGVYEARLAHEEMPERENHVFNPAFSDEEFDPDPFMAALKKQGLPWKETFKPVKVP